MVDAGLEGAVLSGNRPAAMTVWITDRPGNMGALLPRGLTWPEAPCSNELNAGPALPEILNDDVPVWRTECDDAFGLRSDHAVVMVDCALVSQFDAVMTALKKRITVPDGAIYLALTGSRFRGQHDRAWKALRGNLHLTAHYAVGVQLSELQAVLTMIPAVVAAQAIQEISGGRIQPSIKWINDVLVDGAKVAGVLTATSVKAGIVEDVTFGIGINVAAAPELEYTPFVPRAGCLALHDASLREGLPSLFAVVVRRLDEAIDLVRKGAGGHFFKMYRELAGFIGAEVCIWPDSTGDWKGIPPEYKGRVADLHPDLSLQVEGRNEPLRQGRMAYRADCIDDQI